MFNTFISISIVSFALSLLCLVRVGSFKGRMPADCIYVSVTAGFLIIFLYLRLSTRSPSESQVELLIWCLIVLCLCIPISLARILFLSHASKDKRLMVITCIGSILILTLGGYEYHIENRNQAIYDAETKILSKFVSAYQTRYGHYPTNRGEMENKMTLVAKSLWKRSFRNTVEIRKSDKFPEAIEVTGIFDIPTTIFPTHEVGFMLPKQESRVLFDDPDEPESSVSK